jgi:hypothetical protein
MKNKITYSYVRTQSPLGDYRYNTFIGHFFSARISPIFTILFIKLGVIPNIVTLLMIGSGFFGALLFSFESVWIKLIGFGFIALWFVLDCSDGEVARITKQFSTMGKELDYVAHTLNHPFFILSYGYSLFLMEVNEVTLFVSLSAILILDLMHRGVMGLNLIYQIKTEPESDDCTKTRLSFIKYFISNLALLPNFVTFLPLIIILSNVFSIDLFSVYIYLTALCYLVVVPRALIILTMRFVRS